MAIMFNNDIIVLLKQLADRIIDADCDSDNMSYYFKYGDEDLLNAFIVFNHVWMSHAIHKGVLTMENAEVKMLELRKAINDTYGIDPTELSKKVMEELNGTDTEKNSSEE